ncbi:MAG: HAMP domain-containing protein [Nitrospirae bacterium]|nr:MAG: HAMP domain-containing protein [Nitrospirota bacterium]
MSLQKKIILSFLISSALVAALALAGAVGFIEIRKEIRYLELSDTLRSKTLQLRRHEKNFLLYREAKERESVYAYVKELRTIIQQSSHTFSTDKLRTLHNKIDQYSETFSRIELLSESIRAELGRLEIKNGKNRLYTPIVETTFLESPLVNAELLIHAFGLNPETAVIQSLYALDKEITSLRKEGEEILMLSKDLDSSAREKVERVIGYTQKAALVLIPLFLLVGLSALFVISRSVVNHIKMLTGAIEKTGKGDFSALSVPHEQDEVGRLIDAFNKMENDLIERDREITQKSEELLQSRKLASIGTLASGVAHELNNPLNNIYISAQILSKEIGDQETCPGIVKETVSDIYSQTLRVKRIVSDLLEFSREKPPELLPVDLVALIKEVLHQMTASGELDKVRYAVRSSDRATLRADRHLMEQVFINLFTNAVQAMNGEGDLGIEIEKGPDSLICRVSDTGPGIPAENLQRIFDPFYTTKGRGTGLGLAIVYTIIEKHKGRISVESTMNKGTTFTIVLPGGTWA